MLEIKTKKAGAELTSIKLNEEEKLHQGKEHWNRQAPILFPIVGQIKDGQTLINNKQYKMRQHGFARDMEFEEIGENKYLLKSSFIGSNIFTKFFNSSVLIFSKFVIFKSFGICFLYFQSQIYNL